MGKRLLSFICAECGEELPINECVVISGKRYCKKCSPARESEANAYTEISDFVYKLVDEDKDAIVFVLSQLSALKKKYDWKYTGILRTLKYAYGPLNDFKEPIEKGYSIKWIVEYFYPIARKQFEEEQKIKHLPAEILKQAYLPATNVYVKESEILKREEIERERIKTRIYGPSMDLDDLDDTELEEF